MHIWNYQGVKIATFFTFLESVFQVLIFYLFSYLVSNNIKDIIKNFINILIVAIVYSLIMFLKTYFLEQARKNISKILANETDIYLSNMTVSKFQLKNEGEHLSNYTNDIDKVISLILDKYISKLGFLFTSIFTFIALLMIHYSIGIIALVSLFIMSFIPTLFQKKLSNYIQQVQLSAGKYTNGMRELIQGFMTFLENNSFMMYFKKSYKENDTYRNNIKNANIFAGVMSATLTFF